MKFRVSLISVCGALTALMLAGCQSQQGWREFRSEEGRFLASVPRTLKKSTERVNTAIGALTMYMFSATHKNIEYAVAYADYPDFVAKDPRTSTLLDGARDGAVANVKGKLLSEELISIGDYPGRDIKVEAPDGVHILRARLFLVGRRLYQALVVTTKEDTENESVTQFLDSFALTGTE